MTQAMTAMVMMAASGIPPIVNVQVACNGFALPKFDDSHTIFTGGGMRGERDETDATATGLGLVLSLGGASSCSRWWELARVASLTVAWCVGDHPRPRCAHKKPAWQEAPVGARPTTRRTVVSSAGRSAYAIGSLRRADRGETGGQQRHHGDDHRHHGCAGLRQLLDGAGVAAIAGCVVRAVVPFIARTGLRLTRLLGLAGLAGLRFGRGAGGDGQRQRHGCAVGHGLDGERRRASRQPAGTATCNVAVSPSLTAAEPTSVPSIVATSLVSRARPAR